MLRPLMTRLLVASLVLGAVGCNSEKGAARAQEPAAPVKAPTGPLKKPVAPLELEVPPAPPEKINDTDFTKMSAHDLLVLSRTAAREQHFQVAAIAQYWYVKKEQDDRYDLACYLARSGKTDAAFYWLQLAASEDGVDPHHVAIDPDLKSLAADPRWPKLLDYMRDCNRYFETADIKKTVVVVPTGYKQGTPIGAIVWLHGYGSRPDDFVNAESQHFADQLNMALIGISATRARGPRRFMWAVDVEKDLARVRAGLAEASEQVSLEKRRLVMLGFSQGAQVGVELAVRHPEDFAGAILFSAGSKSQLEGVKPSALLAKRGFVVCCNADERPATVKLSAYDADWLRAADAKLIHKAYPDVADHAFPADFDERFADWVKFVLDAGK